MQACFCGTGDGKTLQESAMEGVNIIIIHWGRTGWCLGLPRESGRSRLPESGVAPLASARRLLPPSLG